MKSSQLMKDYLMAKLGEMQQAKHTARREPDHVTGSELRSAMADDCREAVCSLEDSGQVAVGCTLNGSWFRLTEEPSKLQEL